MTATPVALLNAQIFFDASDLTGVSNAVHLVDDQDVKDATTFGTGGFRAKLAGLQQVQVDHTGFMAVPHPDSGLFAELGNPGKVMTVASDVAPGAVAYSFQGAEASYAPFNSAVGEIAAVTGTVMSDSPDGLVRGVLALPSTAIADSTTTNGVGCHLGAVTGSERLFMAVHVLGAGASANVRVQSAPDNTFASPTFQRTVNVTATGGVWATPVAAPITDSWFRAHIDSVTGAFQIAVFLGVQ